MKSFHSKVAGKKTFKNCKQRVHGWSVLTGKMKQRFFFFLIHLNFFFFFFFFRVSHCTECKMSASNLAKVFGPTIVQNSSSNLEPMQMLQEAKWQPKVGGVGK